MEMEDARFPSGTVLVPVLEVERRKNHIDLINPTHPLLAVALDCLKNKERECPSAQELCHRIATLKAEPQYSQSVQEGEREGRRGGRGGGEIVWKLRRWQPKIEISERGTISFKKRKLGFEILKKK